MSQTSRKTSSTQPSAKLTDIAEKAARQTYAATESGRNSAENVVKIGVIVRMLITE